MNVISDEGCLMGTGGGEDAKIRLILLVMDTVEAAHDVHC